MKILRKIGELIVIIPLFSLGWILTYLGELLEQKQARRGGNSKRGGKK